jgi:hypothetical protein
MQVEARNEMTITRMMVPGLAAALVAMGCSEKKDVPDTTADTAVDDGGGLDGPPGGWARVIPNTAFEGLDWLVIGLQPQGSAGPDLTGAVVSIQGEFGDDVLITDQRCNRVRCAIVVEVKEFMPPIGQPIPPPIEAQNVMIQIDPPSGEWMVGTLSVFPLDFTDHYTDTMPLRFHGHYMMSSFRMTAGTLMEVNTSDLSAPGRLFVAGPVELAGLIDLSGGDAEGTTPGRAGLGAGAGGEEGAPGGMPGGGPGGGQPGFSGGGGGGGSYGGAGTDGQDGTGTGGAAGATCGEANVECLVEAEATGCGGSGGGGCRDAAGGGGGSGLLIVSLSSMILDGATIDVSGGAGGAGTSGGGGGSGGNLWLLSPEITGTATIDTTGGAGGGATTGGEGGNGGAGRIRIDGLADGADLTLRPAYHFSGPVIDRSSLELLDTDGHITVTGRADEGAELRLAVDNQSGFGDRNFDAVAGSDGTFTIEVDLNPGISQLTLSQSLGGLLTYGYVGNTFEVAGTTAVVGTLLYVASVPDTE